MVADRLEMDRGGMGALSTGALSNKNSDSGHDFCNSFVFWRSSRNVISSHKVFEHSHGQIQSKSYCMGVLEINVYLENLLRGCLKTFVQMMMCCCLNMAMAKYCC